MTFPIAHAMTTQDGLLTITQHGPAEHDEVSFSFFGDDNSEAFIAVPIWKLIGTLVDLGLVREVEG